MHAQGYPVIRVVAFAERMNYASESIADIRFVC
jgi:hypothetical protein